METGVRKKEKTVREIRERSASVLATVIMEGRKMERGRETEAGMRGHVQGSF